jgi:hypothetical protein
MEAAPVRHPSDALRVRCCGPESPLLRPFTRVRRMPAAVVNHLRFKEAPDRGLFARVETEILPQARSIEGFRGLHIVEAAPDHFILVILADGTEVLDRVATEVGSPWMLDNVVPLLAAPPERHLGPLVATTGS